MYVCLYVSVSVCVCLYVSVCVYTHVTGGAVRERPGVKFDTAVALGSSGPQLAGASDLNHGVQQTSQHASGVSHPEWVIQLHAQVAILGSKHSSSGKHRPQD